MTKIKDIYAGKPDAKDAVETTGLESFLETFVMPQNFNLESLISGTSYYITGYKGTGKTALLYYIDNYIKQIDESTCTSFIFFKGDYSDLKKQEMELLAKRLVSAISIESDVILEASDFECIWRWLLYSRIVEDNEAYNYGIYVNDENWEVFQRKLGQINVDKKKRFLSIPPRISLTCPVTDHASGTVVSPRVEMDFKDAKLQETAGYKMFVKIIEEADELFVNLKRTDIPYYIFIDELEAYYGKEEVFKRDLRLIRDLIFSIKKINQVMASSSEVKTKIICSVRTEIVNAINRFIVSKEINKVTSGFEVPLKWDYTNTNSFSHPIMQILIKRIEYGEKLNGEYVNEKKLIDKWFPEQLGRAEASSYILNSSWCKPRDIVRLIMSAQNCMVTNSECFSQNVINQCQKGYSRDSLTEIMEEMRALYQAEEIDEIITCLTGFRKVFSVDELKARVESLYKNSTINVKYSSVLSDLYRLGVIGNYLVETKSYRWQHKGDDGIILDSIWKLVIHNGLLGALSVNSKQDHYTYSAIRKPEVGMIVNFTARRIYHNVAIGEFLIGTKTYSACLHISQIADVYIRDIEEYVQEGQEVVAKIIGYNDTHKKWNISLKNLDEDA